MQMQRFFTVIVLSLCWPLTLCAQQIIIDPNNVGANDVVEYDPFLDLTIPLVNPLSSPLSLGSSDDLLIGLTSGRGELLIQAGGILSADEVQQANGETIVDGPGSRLTAIGDLRIGRTDAGNFDSDLIISNGGMVEAQNVVIGDDLLLDDGFTTATVVGPGSQLISDGQQLLIGRASGSRSTLNVFDGASVTANELIIGSILSDHASAVADVVVDGLGSSLTADTIRAGGDGTRELFVTNGARVDTQSLFLGSEYGSDPRGGASVTGGGVLHIESGIQLDSTDLHFVGGTLSFGGDRTYNGFAEDSNLNAVLEPRGGALSTGETLSIDGNLNNHATVTLAGGKLSVGTLTNPANVHLVRGTLELRNVDIDVADGGAFGDRLELGFDQRMSFPQVVNIATDGTVDLDGGRLDAGTLENRGLISGSGRLSGALTNRQGGVIRVIGSDALRISGAAAVNRGEIFLLGPASTMEFDEQMTNAPNGEFVVGGTVVAEGGLTNSGSLRLLGGTPNIIGDVTNAGEIEVTGSSVATFFGDFTNTGNLVIQEGSDAVFFDDLALGSSSVLAFEIGESNAEYEALNVLGDLSLAGNLNVQLVNGFSPSVGDVIPLAAIDGTLTGDFDTFAQAGGVLFDVHVDASSIQLEVISLTGLAGDFDLDGDVDGDDFLSWQRNPSLGSLSDWQTNYGNGTASLASTSSVPEPTTSALVCLTATIAAVFRRLA